MASASRDNITPHDKKAEQALDKFVNDDRAGGEQCAKSIFISMASLPFALTEFNDQRDKLGKERCEPLSKVPI
jgi:hypothetical protein